MSPFATTTMTRRLLLASSLPFLLLSAQAGLSETAPAAPADAETMAMRSIETAGPCAALPPEHGAAIEGLVLSVFFAFDGAELTAASRRAIDALAPQLRAHLAEGGEVLIEGHADATGAPAYNLALSERRARAVAHYLREAWGIPLRRLQLRAWGEGDLRRPELPHHAENRRVEIVLHDAPPPVVSRGLSLRPRAGGYLDIDDFGGAPSPLPAPLSGAGRIITAPTTMPSPR